MSDFSLPKMASGLICLAGSMNSGKSALSTHMASQHILKGGGIIQMPLEISPNHIFDLTNSLAENLARERAEKERLLLEKDTPPAKSKPRKNRL